MNSPPAISSSQRGVSVGSPVGRYAPAPEAEYICRHTSARSINVILVESSLAMKPASSHALKPTHHADLPASSRAAN